ncbi:hypothetical protein B0I62_000823 [Clostridium beijerinckii]|nr:hypothetical protein [Clostridium beijerinckii]
MYRRDDDDCMCKSKEYSKEYSKEHSKNMNMHAHIYCLKNMKICILAKKVS